MNKIVKVIQMLLPPNNYPKLDVHGETRDTICTVLKEFIMDNIKLKKSTIIVVHGKGTGILKEEIHYYLKQWKIVKNFHLDYWNQGITIIELNI